MVEEDPSFWSGNGVKRFEDIDVGLKSLSSYTVSGLAPGVEYVFELCLKKGNFVIGITSAVYRTKRQGFEADAGIQVWSITKTYSACYCSFQQLSCLGPRTRTY